MSMEALIREIRDSQIRSEERLAAMDKRLSDLEATRSRIGWGILGALGASLASLFSVIIRPVLVIACAIPLVACGGARDAAVANLAATQWEAAAAIRAGVPPDAPAAAIQAAAAAQLRLLGHTYAPAGVTP